VATICCAECPKRIGNLDLIEVTLPDGPDQCGTFEEIITRKGNNDPWDSPAPVPGAPDALQRDSNRVRRTNLADLGQSLRHRSPARVRRSPRERGFLRFQFVLAASEVARKASVVRRDSICSQPFCEMMKHPLGQPARVDENERRRCCAQVPQCGRTPRPHLIVETDPSSLRALRQQDRGGAMSDVHNRRSGRPFRSESGPRVRWAFRGDSRCGPGPPWIGLCDERFQPFQR